MQYREVEFQNLVRSYPINRSRAALFPSGRYRGFDTILPRAGTPVNAGAILIELDHQGNPFYPVLEDNTSGPATGVVVSDIGAVLFSDDTYNFEIEENTDGQGRDRYDAIYVSYSWVEVQDGAEFTVELLKGNPGGYLPALANPNTEILVGFVKVPALPTLTMTFNDLTYTATPIPNVGYQDSSQYVPVSGGTFDGGITINDYLYLFGVLRTAPGAGWVDSSVVLCNKDGFYHEVSFAGQAVVIDQIKLDGGAGHEEAPVGTIEYIKFTNVGVGSYLKSQYPATVNCIINASLNHLYLESGNVVGIIKVNSATNNHVWQVFSFMRNDLTHNFYNITQDSQFTQAFPRAAASVNIQNNTVLMKGKLEIITPIGSIGAEFVVGQLSQSNQYPQYTIRCLVPINDTGDTGMLTIYSNGNIKVYVPAGIDFYFVQFDGVSYQTKEY